MERIWLKSYPPGVSSEIDFAGFATLVDMFDDAVRRHRDRTAYICMGKKLTYGEIDALSEKLAGYLASRGLRRGERVAIMMPNVLQYPIAVNAILRAGYIAVNVNPLYTPRELEHQLRDSGARAIIILDLFAHTLEETLARTAIKHIVIARLGDLLGTLKGPIVNFVATRKAKAKSYDLPQAVSFNKALAEGAKHQAPRPAITGDDIAVLQYTGGTTGLSKGAVLTHHALLAAVMSADQWLQPMLRGKDASDGLTFVCALPLYHVYAFVNIALMAARIGGNCLLIVNPRDIKGFVKELSQYAFHVFPAVNTLFNGLAHDEDFAKLDFSKFLGSTGGGAAIQESVATQWRKITGAPIAEGYGLSETCSGVTCNRLDIDQFTGTVGLPMPGVDIRILDDDGHDAPVNGMGEVCIKGPQVMQGYWNQPEETNKAMTSDGWFRSGDIGTMDEKGYVRIVDRKKDMIIVSGFNVYPNEIEAVAAGCPGVLEAAVVGAPDDKSGEMVMLFVVRKDPELTVETLKAFMRERLTGYKMPHYIEFREALPKTNVGKILRRELRNSSPEAH